jgi:hypothetical protein
METLSNVFQQHRTKTRKEVNQSIRLLKEPLNF